jgi:PD-(D/E)XK nuclease superfamily protein
VSHIPAYRRARVDLNKKAKGDLAELKVAADLRARGYRIAIPYGEDWDFDLILCRDDEKLERVQVKYARSDGCVLMVRPRSHSLTNGKVRATKYYTAATIDWLAVWDAALDRCYYIPATDLGSGMNLLTLRLSPTRNNQVLGIRPAEKYASI